MPMETSTDSKVIVTGNSKAEIYMEYSSRKEQFQVHELGATLSKNTSCTADICIRIQQQ